MGGKAKLYFDPNLRYPKDAIPAEIKSSMQKMSKLCDVVLAGEGEMNALEMYPVEGQTYIVKCGSKGSKLIDSSMKTILTVPATDHVAVDATGAGDTFAAAYIAGELQGMDIKAAMVYASVAAGFSVTKAGARNMPSDAEIKEYILKIIYRWRKGMKNWDEVYYFPKEIYEQADAISNCLKILRDELEEMSNKYKDIKDVHIVGSGDCYFIGSAATEAFRQVARIEAMAYEAYDYYINRPRSNRQNNGYSYKLIRKVIICT